MIKTLLLHRDETQQQALADALRRLDCQVVPASGARNAMKQLERDPDIDVAFFDLHLPDGQGVELLKSTRFNGRLQQVPVVMTCEDCDLCAIEVCRSLSTSSILKLPATDQVLQAKLDHALSVGKPVVLIVDDEEIIRDILATLLRLERFRCITAGDGRSALDILKDGRINAVVSDILMPGMTGLDLLVESKEKYPHIPVILITGHSGKYKPADLIAAGADGYFTKPFKNTQLVITLRQVLKEYQKKADRTQPLFAALTPPAK
ncbi:response regulator [bacterium]|nr:response regulator [bacterium]MCB2201687.1 response regulator [bacterium]